MPEERLRCFCSGHPLLGVVRQDADGRWFLHVKIFKQGRVFGEVIANSGEVRIRCRSCQRWHKVTIRRQVRFEEQELPENITV